MVEGAEEALEAGQRAITSKGTLQGFWCGRTLQCLYALPLERRRVVVETLRDTLPRTHPPDVLLWLEEHVHTFHTSLSPGVSQLVQGNQQTMNITWIKDDMLQDDEGLLQWEQLPRPQQEEEEEDDEKHQFTWAAGVLRRLSEQADQWARRFTGDALDRTFRRLLQTTAHGRSIPEILNLHHADRSLASFIMGTAVLERALVEIYCAVHGQGTREDSTESTETCRSAGGYQWPRMLRDLLTTDELRRVLGATAVFWLRALIGPPTSLNLRNIAWHGFLAPMEFPRSFAPLLIQITLSVLRDAFPFLDAAFGTSDRRVPLVDLALFVEPLQETPLVVWDPHNLEDLDALVRRSYFLAPGREDLVCESLRDIRSGHSYRAIVQILPVLEHCLRRAFVALNRDNCSPGMICAESAVHFTTMDIIVAPLTPSGHTNSLLHELGPGVVHALRDLFAHTGGPRLRDRIAHGETGNVVPIPSWLAMELAGVLVALCRLFDPPMNGMPASEKVADAWLARFRRYHPIFHPASEIRRDLRSVTSVWRTLTMKFGLESEEKNPNSEEAHQLARLCRRIVVGCDGLLEYEGVHIFASTTNHEEPSLILLPSCQLDPFPSTPRTALWSLLRKIVARIQETMYKILAIESELQALTAQRRARTNQRRSLANLCASGNVICTGIGLLLTFVARVTVANERNTVGAAWTKLATHTLTVAERSVTFVSDREWARLRNAFVHHAREVEQHF